MFTEYLDTHDLKTLLLPPGGYHPFPRRQEREAWQAMDADIRRQIIAWGDEALSGYPMLTATQFLAFVRTGDRQAYEKPYFARRKLLIGAVLAECLLDDGAHLDAVIDGVWCICDEACWMISAHNGSFHDGALRVKDRALPDVTNPYIDLFAAQTAATLAFTLYFLEDKFDSVSPRIARRIRALLEERILHPFLTHDDFWWMGMIRKDVNNWTPWILSNILFVTLLTERDGLRQAETVARALRMLDSYLNVMPEDGGCDEGAGYFNMAGSSLLDCLEAVYEATAGRVSFYDVPLIRRIGEFPLRAHVAGPYFLNFADCDVKPLLDGSRIWRYGQRTGNDALQALGAVIHHAQLHDVHFPDTPQMNRQLHLIFDKIPPCDPPKEPSFSAMPALQVFSWRKGRLYAAIKGGHNGESHNHNDVGTFVLYVDGEPQVVDVGNMVYTAKTFGPERYTLPNTRSMNHNLPLPGGIEQAPGTEHAAHHVSADENGARLDLAAAYPVQAGVRTLERSLTLTDGSMTLTDEVFLNDTRGVTWVFMLRTEPVLTTGSVSFGHLVMHHDPALTQQIEVIPVTDARMSRNFPGCFWRLTLTAGVAAEHHQHFTFSLA